MNLPDPTGAPMNPPELPRDSVPEPDPAADAQRRAAQAEQQKSSTLNVALFFTQWVCAFGAGYWSVASCASVADGLPVLAGFGLIAVIVAGQSAAMALSWLWLIFNIPRLWRWLKAAPGTPMAENRSDRAFEIVASVVAVALALLGAGVMGIAIAALVPSCRGPGIVLLLPIAAALVSIPTPRLLRSGAISGAS